MKTTGVTTIPFIPRTNKVVLEATFTVSTLNLFNPDVISSLNPDSVKVVAVGSGIPDIEIGDKVAIMSSKDLFLMDFKWNNQALKVKQKIHSEGKSIIGVTSISTKEYYITDVYNIVGVHTTESNKE